MFKFPDKMMRVFADEKLQQQFERDGYVIVDFYTPEQIAELDALYHKLHPVDEKGFYPSTFSSDKNYRTEADKEIRRVGDSWISKNLIDYKVMCGSFIVKYPGPDSIMCTHQDMTLVDETKYTGINIWCPLVDLTDYNGVLKAIPGSHRLVPTYRGSTIAGLYDDVQTEILDYMQPMYLKAGQAIIFDQSIIHFSPPNISDKIRITTNIYFTHKESEFQICYWNKEMGNKVEVFEQDDTFMTNFEQFGENIHDRPKIGKSKGLFDYNFPKLTPQWLEEAYGKPQNKKHLFKDPALQQQFDTMGYVKVPFLTAADIQALTDKFYELHPGLSLAGFQSSSYSSDYTYKKLCSDEIAKVFNPHFEKIFKNYRPFGSAYLFKQPDPYSMLPIHQDWTIVNEEKYVALNIWVPLIDTNENNGTLYVLPGSQYGKVKALRCPTLPMFFEGNEQLMMDECIPVNAKAGEAVILNQSLVHYSPPNSSDKIRIAITSGVMSAEPKMIFHYRPDKTKDEVEVIQMEDNFLISFEDFMNKIYERPTMGTSLGMRSYTPKVYSREELDMLLEELREKTGRKKIAVPQPAQQVQTKPEEKSVFKKLLELVGI